MATVSGTITQIKLPNGNTYNISAPSIAGGTTGQILVKTDNSDFNFTWTDTIDGGTWNS